MYPAIQSGEYVWYSISYTGGSSRTKLLFNEFADALSHADKVVLAKIYAARETDTLGISSADLCEKIKSLGKECVYIDNFEDIENIY